MYQNASNAMETLRKASFRNTTYFLPIISHDAIFDFSIASFFNMVSVQGIVYSPLVSQLLNIDVSVKHI